MFITFVFDDDFLFIVIIYVFTLPSSAVTIISNLFSPVTIFLIPVPVTSAVFSSSAVA